MAHKESQNPAARRLDYRIEDGQEREREIGEFFPLDEWREIWQAIQTFEYTDEADKVRDIGYCAVKGSFILLSYELHQELLNVVDWSLPMLGTGHSLVYVDELHWAKSTALIELGRPEEAYSAYLDHVRALPRGQMRTLCFKMGARLASMAVNGDGSQPSEVPEPATRFLRELWLAREIKQTVPKALAEGSAKITWKELDEVLFGRGSKFKGSEPATQGSEQEVHINFAFGKLKFEGANVGTPLPDDFFWVSASRSGFESEAKLASGPAGRKKNPALQTAGKSNRPMWLSGHKENYVPAAALRLEPGHHGITLFCLACGPRRSSKPDLASIPAIQEKLTELLLTPEITDLLQTAADELPPPLAQIKDEVERNHAIFKFGQDQSMAAIRLLREPLNEWVEDKHNVLCLFGLSEKYIRGGIQGWAISTNRGDISFAAGPRGAGLIYLDTGQFQYSLELHTAKNTVNQN